VLLRHLHVRSTTLLLASSMFTRLVLRCVCVRVLCVCCACVRARVCAHAQRCANQRNVEADVDVSHLAAEPARGAGLLALLLPQDRVRYQLGRGYTMPPTPLALSLLSLSSTTSSSSSFSACCLLFVRTLEICLGIAFYTKDDSTAFVAKLYTGPNIHRPPRLRC